MCTPAAVAVRWRRRNRPRSPRGHAVRRSPPRSPRRTCRAKRRNHPAPRQGPAPPRRCRLRRDRAPRPPMSAPPDPSGRARWAARAVAPAAPARAGRAGSCRSPTRSTRYRSRRCGRCAGRDVGRAAQSPRQPVVRQAHRRRRIGVRGFVVGQPPQFGRGDRRDRHHADPLRPLACAAELVDELGRRVARTSVVPQQRISNDRACAVQAHHAVLLGADRHRRHIVEPPGGVDAGLQRGPPQLRIDLGAVGMRRRRGPHDLTGVRVADDHLAGLGGRVDSRNECHACEATPG